MTSKTAIAFGAAPPNGYELEWGGQAYKVVQALNTMVRGQSAVSVKWETVCPDCKQPFQFETGGRRRFLPKRDKVCNGVDDKDGQERRAFARHAWAEGMKAAREAKSGAVKAIEAAQLNQRGMLECVAVLANGQKLELRWAPGDTFSDELPVIQKAVPLLAAEHKRLMTERLLS